MRRAAAAPGAETADLFGEPILPEGFRYMPDVLTRDEEADLVERFARLALQPFEFQGFLANRRIYTFGRSYIFAGQKPRSDAGIPDALRPLMEIAASISGSPAEAFEQIMISEYPAGAGIGWHRDRPTYEDIVGISLLAPCALRLRLKVGDTWDRRSASIAPRSAYLLHGPVRTQWQHSIAPMEALRFSVTLRSFRRSAEEQSAKPPLRRRSPPA